MAVRYMRDREPTPTFTNLRRRPAALVLAANPTAATPARLEQGAPVNRRLTHLYVPHVFVAYDRRGEDTANSIRCAQSQASSQLRSIQPDSPSNGRGRIVLVAVDTQRIAGARQGAPTARSLPFLASDTEAPNSRKCTRLGFGSMNWRRLQPLGRTIVDITAPWVPLPATNGGYAHRSPRHRRPATDREKASVTTQRQITAVYIGGNRPGLATHPIARRHCGFAYPAGGVLAVDHDRAVIGLLAEVDGPRSRRDSAAIVIDGDPLVMDKGPNPLNSMGNDATRCQSGPLQTST